MCPFPSLIRRESYPCRRTWYCVQSASHVATLLGIQDFDFRISQAGLGKERRLGILAHIPNVYIRSFAPLPLSSVSVLKPTMAILSPDTSALFQRRLVPSPKLLRSLHSRLPGSLFYLIFIHPHSFSILMDAMKSAH